MKNSWNWLCLSEGVGWSLSVSLYLSDSFVLHLKTSNPLFLCCCDVEAFCITFHSVGARILRAVLMKWNTFHLLTFYSDLISCQHRTSNLGTIVKLVILVLLCVLYAKRVLLPSLLQQLPSALSSFCFHSIWFSSHEVIRRTLIACWLRLRGKCFFFSDQQYMLYLIVTIYYWTRKAKYKAKPCEYF